MRYLPENEREYCQTNYCSEESDIRLVWDEKVEVPTGEEEYDFSSELHLNVCEGKGHVPKEIRNMYVRTNELPEAIKRIETGEPISPNTYDMLTRYLAEKYRDMTDDIYEQMRS